MIKKLDTLVIKAFIGPFFATFLISLFVLVMQFFWLYIDDVVGKGLDILTIGRLILYVAATAVPLALPLALLLSSIMTFGNLGESFELVAIKSAGIPLLRFMRPLLIVAIFISGIAFLFANNIIPVANLKFNALKYDIIVTKPAFDIKEGVFYDKIEGFVIKLEKKEKDDSTIRNIVIYERNYGLQDNLMIAQSGIMKVTPDKRFLEFILHNGWRYQERGNTATTNTELIRLGFKQYKKIFDLSSFQMNRTEDSLFQYNPQMLSVRQLNYTIDSLNKLEKNHYLKSKKLLSPYFGFVRFADSNWNNIKKQPTKKVKNFDSILPAASLSTINEKALNQIYSAKSSYSMMASDYIEQTRNHRRHWIEWHRKFTLSVACIVLFMIGAPLGSIIRKGGLGTPLVFSIIFFVLFHLLNTFGEKFAKEAVTSTFLGMWLSTLILIPIGIFLTIKAMHDSQIFNQEVYFKFFKKIGSFFPFTKSKSSSS